MNVDIKNLTTKYEAFKFDKYETWRNKIITTHIVSHSLIIIF